MSNNWSEIFEHALRRVLRDIESQFFEIQTEKDIQALLFHHSLALAAEHKLLPQVHAEPTMIERKQPDLVFGENEIFVEIKLSKSGSGGYTDALGSIMEDVSLWRLAPRHVQ